MLLVTSAIVFIGPHLINSSIRQRKELNLPKYKSLLQARIPRDQTSGILSRNGHELYRWVHGPETLNILTGERIKLTLFQCAWNKDYTGGLVGTENQISHSNLPNRSFAYVDDVWEDGTFLLSGVPIPSRFQTALVGICNPKFHDGKPQSGYLTEPLETNSNEVASHPGYDVPSVSLCNPNTFHRFKDSRINDGWRYISEGLWTDSGSSGSHHTVKNTFRYPVRYGYKMVSLDPKLRRALFRSPKNEFFEFTATSNNYRKLAVDQSVNRMFYWRGDLIAVAVPKTDTWLRSIAGKYSLISEDRRSSRFIGDMELITTSADERYALLAKLPEKSVWLLDFGSPR